MAATPQVTAFGPIQTAVLVVNGSVSDTVTQASGAGVSLFGISQQYPNNFPVQSGGTGAQTATQAAASGQQVSVRIEGERTYLTAGLSGWTPGALLTADISGCGQPVVVSSSGTTGGFFGAQGLATIAAGNLGEVIVRFGRA